MVYLRIFIYMLKQDDPVKCTAEKLVKFKLAERTKFLHPKYILLNPKSTIPLSKSDLELSRGICAVDCSWEKADNVFLASHSKMKLSRRLPAMLASNPINYAKLHKLSTAEALAGSLYILGQKERSFDILNKFKWGHTFLELNKYLLEDYTNAKNPADIKQIEKDYFQNPS